VLGKSLAGDYAKQDVLGKSLAGDYAKQDVLGKSLAGDYTFVLKKSLLDLCNSMDGHYFG